MARNAIAILVESLSNLHKKYMSKNIQKEQ